MKTCTVLDYPVHVETLAGLFNVLQAGLNEGHHQHVVTLNPEMLMAGEANPDFGGILKSAQIILPDGAGIVWALKHQGVSAERVPGIEFSQRLIEGAHRKNEPIALIGAHPDVNEAAVSNLTRQHPGLNIVYSHHGYFTSPEDRAQVARACAETSPKYVFVALGVPAQELWIREFMPLFSSPTAFVGVGGSFDIWSGLKQRAHPLFLKLNLEWLYRITSEPFRLKRVYKTLPLFVVKVLLYRPTVEPTDEYRHAKPNPPRL